MTQLWLSDRSRYEAQHNHCARHRFTEYHSGPTGYGIRRKAQSLYASTGIYLHQVTEAVTNLQIEHGWDKPLIPQEREAVRNAVLAGVARYHRVLDTRGLRSDESTDIQRWIIDEQATLIEGLGWAYVFDLLPWLTANFNPITVEKEEFAALACTCGLGSLIGNQPDHESRDCGGVGWMSRADLVLERRSDGELGWHDHKSAADPFKAAFDKSWQENVQFAAGVLGAERRLGKPISHYYIHGFAKGRRYEQDVSRYLRHLPDKTMTKLQGSPLCYGYLKEADPPTTLTDDWQAKYEWTERDELTGDIRKRRLGKGYQKREIWREGNFPNKPPEMTNVEYWTEWIRKSEGEGAGVVHTVGPYPRPNRLIEAFVREMPAAERDWQNRLWRLYEARREAEERLAAEKKPQPTHDELEFQPEVRLAIDHNFPRNWSGCENYFGDRCEFYPICHFDAGWDAPASIGFVSRRPHHDPEIEQMVARGLEVPEDEDFEEED